MIKPFSYFFKKLFEEVPWRLMQGALGLIAFMGLQYILGPLTTFVSEPGQIVLVVIIAAAAFLLSFTFKMILGISALWITDYHGLQQLMNVVILAFAGYILPIELYPEFLQRISYLLPFAYVIYYPIVALQGHLTTVLLLRVLLIQALWIGLFAVVYRYLWKKGIRKFAAVGQ